MVRWSASSANMRFSTGSTRSSRNRKVRAKKEKTEKNPASSQENRVNSNREMTDRESLNPEVSSSRGNSARMETGNENRLTGNAVREEAGSLNRTGSSSREKGKRNKRRMELIAICDRLIGNMVLNIDFYIKRQKVTY